MGFNEDIKKMADDRKRTMHTYTAKDAYIAIIMNLTEDMKHSIRNAAQQKGELTGVDFLKKHVGNGIGKGDDSTTLTNIALQSGFIERDYDSGFNLADIVSVTKTKHLLSDAEYHYNYTTFGQQILKNIQAVMMQDKIKVAFFYTSAAEGGIHSKTRYKVPFSLPEYVYKDKSPSVLCYEWTVL